MLNAANNKIKARTLLREGDDCRGLKDRLRYKRSCPAVRVPRLYYGLIGIKATKICRFFFLLGRLPDVREGPKVIEGRITLTICTRPRFQHPS